MNAAGATRRFRARRHQNWITLGLLYASFYVCRYNLAMANKTLGEHFGWSNAELGLILTAWFWAYAIGQVINGILTDRIGGKRTLLIGTAGTVAGFVDAWQYVGAGLTGVGLGWVLDRLGWQAWPLTLIGFAGPAMLLMAPFWDRRAPGAP